MVNEAGDLFFISPFVSINFLSFEGKKVVVKSVFLLETWTDTSGSSSKIGF